MKIEKVGVIGAGQMGSGIAHVCALAGYDVVHGRHQRRRACQGEVGRSSAICTARPHAGLITQSDARCGYEAHPPRGRAECDEGPRSRHRGGDRKRAGQAEESFRTCVHASARNTMLATNTSSISITRLAASHRPAGTLHRPAFHESGAGDAAWWK